MVLTLYVPLRTVVWGTAYFTRCDGHRRSSQMEKIKAEAQRLEEASKATFIALSQSYTLQQTKENLLPSETEDGLTSRAVPETTLTRQQTSNSVQSIDQNEYLPGSLSHIYEGADDSALCAQKSVLYLAYGSNLASQTFLGMRGIRPLSQLNVLVPDLRLTFDLPGIPYIEPCFAGTHFRDASAANGGEAEEKLALLNAPDTDQDRYKGPLIGVVYEVTLPDYAKIIATEGGGRGYKDIVVTCYPFPNGYDPTDPIPEHPETRPLKAHTLLSPAGMQELLQPQTRSRIRTPRNARYTQPSARYLNLITTGAAEHSLPLAYRAYLDQLQPYRITSYRQRVGMVLFLVMWGPWILLLLVLSRVCARPDGRSPAWVGRLNDLVMVGVWSSYDNVFVHIFGDGEKTIER
ncbi:hypothetical protein BDW72DRAFT_205287 [Aspergillus terricola var. indicus]